MSKRRSDGFTIVELLIATLIFSFVLVVLTSAIIQIGRIYSKGITYAKTQEAARSLVNDIGQSIQYSAAAVIGPTEDPGAPGNFSLCVGSRYYSYRPGQQRTGSNQAVVVRSVTPGQCPDPDMSLNNGGAELLAEGMRMPVLGVDKVSDTKLYHVTARVVYGDDDVICSGGDDCGTTDNIDPADLTSPTLRCKDVRTGTQFCAAAELTTTVERRLK
jgi:type II secretory pathway pseudopilin PulG